ncbi:putative mitochondrial inner membrane protein 1 protein [Phaeoacremonium minimum UCRPA7]|uniref:Putative mitochondrial inner membrane protein 1 protein n=1 Tax=Phaeoacremonium minimum (strain UCR-PA7) TaxID=1286976 RepID=R8B9T1_PHAM7|nr:putative mitochondrial inner membrane protein 1 protein [Phaeoacremonium minimum UCRPA7]EON96069.1 putative mitochondrial inner membrane protein 1 protein [Phaeoacremonium minimum UCRPA7]
MRANLPALSKVQRSRYATIPDKRDVEFEKETAKKKIEARPDEVSTQSSVRHVFEEASSAGEGVKKDEQDVLKGVKQDLETVKDTFALKTVPPLSYALGIAGTVPYLVTSIATVYLGWDLNTDWPSQSQLLNHIMISPETAQRWLDLLEPIQLSYGAVIISFLGAIHWGLEYAEKTPSLARTRFRYAMGVIAPAVAWPTLLMPVQFALTAQFLAFTALYGADTRATYRGWAPPWYGTYRFVLTFIVGGAILISLIGREKIGADRPRLSNLREKLHKTGTESEKYVNWEKLEQEEKERIKKEKEEEEKRKKEEEKKNKKKSKGKKGGKEGDKAEASKDDGKESKKEDGSEEQQDEGDEESKDSGDEDKGGDQDKDEDGGEDDKKEDDKDDQNKGEGGDKEEKKDKGGDGDKKQKTSK